MIGKITVLALMTILVFAGPGEHNGNQMGNNMNGNNNGNMNPYHPDMNQINQEVAGVIIFIYFLAFCVVAGINIVLCVKCMKKRNITRGIKNQMQMKRLEFATNHGFNIQTLNDPRYSQTIHI